MVWPVAGSNKSFVKWHCSGHPETIKKQSTEQPFGKMPLFAYRHGHWLEAIRSYAYGMASGWKQ